MGRRYLLLGILLAGFAAPALAATFVVTNTNDSGPGSLRQAMVLANESPGADQIEFQLPAEAPAIRPLTSLPTITDPVVIGGTRLADVEISGDLAPLGSRGFHITAQDAWITGLVINGFRADSSGNGGQGVFVDGGRARIWLCAIGTNRQRTAVVPNGGAGIHVLNSSNSDIGENLITGNSVGVLIEGNSHSTSITVNTIGTPENTNLSGNSGHGVAVISGVDTKIGYFEVCPGSCPFGNLVAGNGGSGVYLGPNATGTKIGGYNRIGNEGAGNLGHGVEIDGGQFNSIGGTISFNFGAGVYIASGSRNAIQASIHHNGGLGIDLAPKGITANDAGDRDGGPNGLQNFPILSSVVTSPGPSAAIHGTFQSAPSGWYVMQFYASDSCDGSGHGEGAQPFTWAQIVTDASGLAPIDVTFESNLPGGAITATAMDESGNTSEFSPCLSVPVPAISQIQPDSGPHTGGTPVVIRGRDFLPGARVFFAFDVEASNVVVISPTEIHAVTPPLPPGHLISVGVRNPDDQLDLEAIWFSNFLDVPESHIFHDHVETVSRAWVISPCENGVFCVDQPVTRDLMAFHLLVARHGLNYSPPVPTGAVFHDVPPDSLAAAYIEALAAAGVTAGCGGGNYCPGDPVTRARMSVLLLRTLEGPTYAPPPATGTMFLDMPAGAFAAAWIEEIARRGITAGCGGGNFCPDGSTTRGQMAVFLVETFGL